MGMKEEKEIIRTSKDSSRDVIVYNVQQKRCWALVVEQLQQYMQYNIDWMHISKEELGKIIPLNENCDFECQIDLSNVSQFHRSYAFDQLEKMLYIIVRPEVQEGKFSFMMFNSIRLNGNKVTATLPMLSLRWILDFGQKRMFVAFHKPSFLRLTTNYSMDMFLFLSENYNRVKFEIPIDKFKERMGCPKNYDAKSLKKWVLEPAFREFNNKGTVISFEYRFFSKDDKPGAPGRKRLNMIHFHLLKRIEDNEWEEMQ